LWEKVGDILSFLAGGKKLSPLVEKAISTKNVLTHGKCDWQRWSAMSWSRCSYFFEDDRDDCFHKIYPVTRMAITRLVIKMAFQNVTL
jgi:hypothetical protein